MRIPGETVGKGMSRAIPATNVVREDRTEVKARERREVLPNWGFIEAEAEVVLKRRRKKKKSEKVYNREESVLERVKNADEM